MGQFTSNCPQCDAKFYWFLTAPKDYVCDCGRPFTEKEIEESWWKNYDVRMKEIVDKEIAEHPERTLAELANELSMNVNYIESLYKPVP